MAVKAEFPEKLQCLFRPSRYKVLYGGRGGSKSWGVARALLILGAQKPIRVLCAREYQNSLADSVHQLLEDQIAALELGDHYNVQNSYVLGKNGTVIGFEGLRRNATKIKSWEGADICWVEEAQTVSGSSWDILIPTIRKDNSEIWLTFNPDLEDDETYQRFVVDPPPGAVVQKINWVDNPWFSDVLRTEMEHDRRRDPARAKNIWDGDCKSAVDGAIYATEIGALDDRKRITTVPHDPILPVNTYWDLGYNDTNSIWFGQHHGLEHRFIDYYESSGAALPHYAKILKDKAEKMGYQYGEHFLPHDVEVTELSTGRSRRQTMSSLGLNNIVVVKRVDDLLDGIESTRQMLPQCWFDKEACKIGIKALRSYQREFDEKSKTFKQRPMHNWASNGADAFRQFGQGFRHLIHYNEKDLYPEDAFNDS